MNWWLLLLPFISALIGWLCQRLLLRLLFHPVVPKKVLGIKMQGIIPAKQDAIAGQIASFAGTQLLSFDEVEKKLADPKSLAKIMPVIEQHIDQFLRVKLGKEMPFISAFIGEKTIDSLKKIFMKELGTLFPEVMKSYAGNLKNELNVETKIREKIASIETEKIEAALRNNLAKEIRYIEVTGALIGFIIGIIQLALTLVVINWFQFSLSI